jgi:hypothetical protein
VELERTKAELTALGLGLCAISYDTVEIHGAFARRRGITFPLLADPDSAIIRAFGLLDESVAPGSREAGMAHPAILLVDEHGVVRQRFVERQYYHRMTLPAVLYRLGAGAVVTHGLDQRGPVRVRTAATQTVVHPGNRFTLVVDVLPRPGVHVYAPDAGGYQGLTVDVVGESFLTLFPPVYPRPARLALAWTDEPVRGYRGPVRVTVDVACGTRQEMAALLEGGLGLTIHGTLAFQACDDRTCWPPEVVPLRWQFALTPPDLVRAPEELRHRSKA